MRQLKIVVLSVLVVTDKEINSYICGILRVFRLDFFEILIHISFILYSGRPAEAVALSIVREASGAVLVTGVG